MSFFSDANNAAFDACASFGSMSQPSSLGVVLSYDTTHFLVHSPAAVEPEPANGFGQASPKITVERANPAPIVANALQSTANVSGKITATVMRRLLADLFASSCAGSKSSPAFCSVAFSLPLTPQVLQNANSLRQCIREVRLDRKMPQVLSWHLHTPGLFADWVLALSPAPEQYSEQTYLIIAQGVMFYGTEPYFLARKKQLRDCFGRWYRDIIEVNPDGLTMEKYNSLCALFVVLEWFWQRLQQASHESMKAAPYGVKSQVAMESEDEMDSDDSRHPDEVDGPQCDYGRGICISTTEGSRAVCVLCKSEYHIECMQQRCCKMAPSLPCDGRCVFWSLKHFGIICPSCARIQNPEKEPYWVSDWDDAMRAGFGSRRANATMDLGHARD